MLIGSSRGKRSSCSRLLCRKNGHLSQIAYEFSHLSLTRCSIDRAQYRGWILVYIIKDKAANLWMQPLDGSPGHQITNFTADLITAFRWSPDRKTLAVMRRHSTSDVVTCGKPTSSPHSPGRIARSDHPATSHSPASCLVATLRRFQTFVEAIQRSVAFEIAGPVSLDGHTPGISRQ